MSTFTPPERPLRKDAERNRQRILEGAGELFAERGLGVTLDDVAHHAGVGVGTVYRRFPNKELLIDALFEQRIEAIGAIAAEALEIEDPWAAFLFYFEQGSELQARDRGLKELLTCSTHGGTCVVEAKARLRTRVTEIFDRAKAAGVVREDADPLDTPVIMVMLGAVMDRSRDVEPELWRRYLGLVLDGLRPAAATPLAVGPLSVEQLDDVMRHPLRRR
jgi:AcrR family transcriptional regulator